MKILVICQHYWPEPYPLSDVCEELVRRGHEVHVVTGVPNYPMGKTYPDYKQRNRRKEVHNQVRITRTFTIPRRNNVFFRMLNYLSYAISSSWYALWLQEEYDVVFTNQTSPVLMSLAALVYARKWRKRVVMYCMDVWPACLAAGGIRETDLLYRACHILSGWIYRGMDQIQITSRMFREYLLERHAVLPERIDWMPQYAASGFETSKRQTPKRNTVELMFAGNVGAAQDLGTVLDAAEQLAKEAPQLRWHIVGDGSELKRLQQEAKKRSLSQVVFHGRKSAAKMPELYAQADAMLVTLIPDPSISLTLPGKVQTYMAAGKPILAAANGEIPRTIQAAGCGFCAPAGDAAGFARAVRQFLRTDDKSSLGTNARRYYETHFTRTRFMDALEKQLCINAQQAEGPVKKTEGSGMLSA